MNIYLIGFMGCGKSHIGRLLSESLGYHFLDLDDAIEKTAAKSISAIFEERGEIEFREIETTELRKTIDLKDAVIACGGGTACFNNNIKLIKENGLSIFLNPSIESLISRLRSEKTQRPILLGRNDLELIDFIKELLAKRMSFYMQADLVLNVENEIEILEKILAYLN